MLQERIHESHKHELSSSQFSVEQHLRFMCKAKVVSTTHKITDRSNKYGKVTVYVQYVCPVNISLLVKSRRYGKLL